MKTISFIFFIIIFPLLSCEDNSADVDTTPIIKQDKAIIINHKSIDLNKIPEDAIKTAKEKLHIAYGHTSHGSQLMTGMSKLDQFMGGTFSLGMMDLNKAIWILTTDLWMEILVIMGIFPGPQKPVNI